MNDQDYMNILIYLYDEYIRRTIQDFRFPIEVGPLNDKTINIQKDELENSLHPTNVIKALEHIDFLIKYCPSAQQMNEFFAQGGLKSTLYTIVYESRKATALGEKSKFFSIIDNYAKPLIEGLNTNNLPNIVESRLISNINRNIDNPQSRLGALTTLAKAEPELIVSSVSTSNTMSKLNETLSKARQKIIQGRLYNIELLRGLGHIGQGAAILTTNIALALDLLKCEDSSKEDKSKSIASGVLGYWMILKGAKQTKLSEQ
jgi:hypothetical protein